MEFQKKPPKNFSAIIPVKIGMIEVITIRMIINSQPKILTFKGTVKELFVTTSSGFSAEVVRQLKICFYFLPNTSKGTSKLGLNLTP